MPCTSKKDLKKIEKILNRSLKKFAKKLEKSNSFKNSNDLDIVQKMQPSYTKRHNICNFPNTIEPLNNMSDSKKLHRPFSNYFFFTAFILLGLGCIIPVLIPFPLRLHTALFILVLLLIVPIYCYAPKNINKRAKFLVLAIIFTCLIVSFGQVQPGLILREYQQILFEKLFVRTEKVKQH